MKKINKYLIIITITILLSTRVNASSPYNNKTSLSVGVSYSDGTSSVTHANYANSTYSSMGLTTKKITNTTTSNLLSTHSNGTKYLESGIVYLIGHAGYNNISFLNNIVISSSNSTTGSLIGIGSFDNSKTALITFAGCETALQSEYNIARFAYESGAKISMGWTTELNIGSYKNWNIRFNDLIKDKTTSVLSAAQSASNHIYLFNNVKNYKIYGQYNKNPWYFMNTAIIAGNYGGSNNFDDISDYNLNNNKINNKINNINSQLLKFSNDIDLNNYKLEINGVHEKYYDYVLYVDDIRTNLGYTIVENNRGEVSRIVDNMNGYSYNDIKEIVSSIDGNNINLSKLENKILKKHYLTYDNGLIQIKDIIKYYDYETGKLYYVFEIEISGPSGEKILTTHVEEI